MISMKKIFETGEYSLYLISIERADKIKGLEIATPGDIARARMDGFNYKYGGFVDASVAYTPNNSYVIPELDKKLIESKERYRKLDENEISNLEKLAEKGEILKTNRFGAKEIKVNELEGDEILRFLFKEELGVYKKFLEEKGVDAIRLALLKESEVKHFGGNIVYGVFIYGEGDTKKAPSYEVDGTIPLFEELNIYEIKRR